MRGLVRNYTIAGGGKSVEVPIYATVSAAAVSEASDLSNTAVNPSSVTITASEIGVMTTLTDLARNSASRNSEIVLFLRARDSTSEMDVSIERSASRSP